MNKLSIGIIIGILIVAIGIIIYLWITMRMKFIKFSDKISSYIDQLISNKDNEDFVLDGPSIEEETLESKVYMKLKRLSHVVYATKQKNMEQKVQIQEMVSDISHQLKTPIANITMYNDTILNHNLPGEKQLECLKVMQNQVSKLDFLVQSLMKMSRLESNMISLSKEEGNLYDSIASAVASVTLQAEKKKIYISLDCNNPYYLSFDQKWTTEAFFNILDNAVKYSLEGGNIKIIVERLDIFTKISITDSGIGISQENLNNIFKRFFRESKVHKEEGVGIGLYLTREIIAKQGGYVKVKSKEGAGSTFSLYLPNDVDKI